jgi:hypothetical protein
MSKTIAIGLLAGSLVAAGCSAFAPPIHLEGRVADVRALVGDWHGEYVVFGASGRRGTITFILEAGRETATGAVVMIPAGSHEPYARNRIDRDTVVAGREYSISSEVLSIRLVRVENDMIRGDMDGYWDPDRQCVAHTEFYGLVNGTTIEGTFRTTYSAPFLETSGRWFVKKATATLPSGNRS